MNSSPQDLYDPTDQPAQDLPVPAELDYSIPGDLVLIMAGGSRPAVIVRTPSLREDWIPWLNVLSIEAPDGYPTTIEYRGRFYGIERVQKRGTAVEYHLDPWPEGEIHRKIVTYGRKAILDQRSRELAFGRSLRNARRLCPFYPLIGLLPGEIQLSIARHYPINLISAVRWSCFAEAIFALYFLFAGGLLGSVASLVDSSGPGFVPGRLLGLPSHFWIAVSPLILAEAFIRWRALSRRGSVLGNLLLELVARMATRA